MMRIIPPLLLLLVASAAAPSVASSQADPLSSHARVLHQGMRMLLVQSAERMPQESYDYRPINTVRTYAQVLGHIADMHYLNCSIILGEKNPVPRIEATKSQKAEIISALKGALSYCDAAFAGMTDSAGARLVSFNGGKLPRLSLLGVHHMHNTLHYGNLVTYMRLRNIVPPTSDPSFVPIPANR